MIPESDNENLDCVVSVEPKASRPSEAAGKAVLSRISTKPRAVCCPVCSPTPYYCQLLKSNFSLNLRLLKNEPHSAFNSHCYCVK